MRRNNSEILESGVMGRDDWEVADILVSDAVGGHLIYPAGCYAVSISPKSEADAIIVSTRQNPDGILVTSKTPFMGVLTGPLYYVPYYSGEGGAYSIQLIFWKEQKIWLPPTFLDTTKVGARNKFSV